MHITSVELLMQKLSMGSLMHVKSLGLLMQKGPLRH